MLLNPQEAKERRGQDWCPQLTPQEEWVLVAAGSSPVLTFSVANIQVKGAET